MPKLYSSDDGVNMAGTHVNNRGWQYHKPDPSIQKLPKIASTPIDMLQGKCLAWLFIHEAKVEHQPNVKRAYTITRSAGYVGDELSDRRWPKGFTNPREHWVKNHPSE